jgi:hypothetical protein
VGGLVMIHERVVDEPQDRAVLGSGSTEGVPHREQMRLLLMQFINWAQAHTRHFCTHLVWVGLAQVDLNTAPG